MHTFTINFNMPQTWHELGDKRSRYEPIARDYYSADKLKFSVTVGNSLNLTIYNGGYSPK